MASLFPTLLWLGEFLLPTTGSQPSNSCTLQHAPDSTQLAIVGGDWNLIITTDLAGCPTPGFFSLLFQFFSLWNCPPLHLSLSSAVTPGMSHHTQSCVLSHGRECGLPSLPLKFPCPINGPHLRKTTTTLHLARLFSQVSLSFPIGSFSHTP